MAKGKGSGYVEGGERARSRSPSTPSTATSELRSGAFVRLGGLKGAAHLNGLTGTCGEYDSEAGRWIVLLESGELKSLKADNLTVEENPDGDEEQQERAEEQNCREKAGAAAAAGDEVVLDDIARMASDLDSGFVSCDSLENAKIALEKKETRLEFGGVTDADDLARCLDLVCELLASDVRRLRGVSFAACGLSGQQLRRLAAALKTGSGPTLTALGISKNPGVDEAAWLEVFDSLPKKAMWLDFGDNQLSDSEIAPLVAALDGRDDLDKLYLDGNRLQDLSKLCSALENTGVTNLDLGDNAIDDASAQELAAALPQTTITILVLGSNAISKDGVQTIFKLLPKSSLDTLYLDNTGLDDDCLQVLGTSLPDSELTELHIDNTKISDDGVRALLPHIMKSQLTYIDVSGNNIGEETASMLENSVSEQRESASAQDPS